MRMVFMALSVSVRLPPSGALTVKVVMAEPTVVLSRWRLVKGR